MPKPRSGESQDTFIERCMSSAESVSDYPDEKQRAAVCFSFWERRGNQEDIDFTPPEGVRNAAKRGLELHEEGKSGSGLEAGTVRIARNLAAGKAVSPEQARKGNRFWARNERFLDEPKDSPAYVSALLWGGRPGMSWYRKLYRQLEAREKRNVQMNVGNQVRVNVKTRVNQQMIRREKRNGRDVIIVPSATLPDDVIMNNIKYPAEEIENSYRTLNQTPAPLGHPQGPDGEFISALDPEAINGFYIGAFNANARRENGRVYVDKIIDVEMANSLERGRRVLEAIEKGEPIHTSTGLLCNIEEAGEGDGCEYIARNILFDHDAILMDEPGAATPEQGVGMLVNKARDKAGKQIDVFNVDISDMYDNEIDSLGMELMRAVQRREDVSAWARMKSAVLEVLGRPARETETEANGDSEMTEVSQEQFDELSAKVNGLAEQLDGLDFKAALNEALAPLNEAVEAIQNKDKAAAEAKHKALVERVVNKSMLDEETAKETPSAALEAMLANEQTHFAAPIHGGFTPNGDAVKYELPED